MLEGDKFVEKRKHKTQYRGLGVDGRWSGFLVLNRIVRVASLKREWYEPRLEENRMLAPSGRRACLKSLG